MNKKSFFRVTFCISLLAIKLLAQPLQKITLEDIWVNNTFYQDPFDSYQFTAKKGQFLEISPSKKGNDFTIDIKDVISLKTIKKLTHSSKLIPKGDLLTLEIENISLNNSETKLLITTQSKSIYRYSYSAVYYVFDIKKQELKPLANGAYISCAEFSPDGQKVAYCKENNLFYVDFTLSDEEIKVTSNGIKNEIINGSSDWVYEEEFELIKAFFWSPDSKKIAYYSFNESAVKTYNMQIWAGLYPKDYLYKYPKAGEKNSEIKIMVYNSQSAQTSTLFDGTGKDVYIPRIQWVTNSNIVSLKWMNRNQDTLKIFHSDTLLQSLKPILTLGDENYIEIDENHIYLPDNKGFIISSEESGYRHLYKYDMDGKNKKQLTYGNWEVSALHGFHSKTQSLFYSSKEKSSLEENLYSIDLEGNNKKMITTLSGINSVSFSPDMGYFTTENTHGYARQASLFATEGIKLIRLLGKNEKFQSFLKQYDLGEIKFSTFVNKNGDTLNYYRVTPSNFDSTQKYPVLMAVYGGPGSQEVLRSSSGKNYLWYQYLAQNGFIIYCLDNTGTGGKGAKFKKATTRQLGKLESEDQINFAEYLSKKPFVNASKIGIWGWSFGGYLSSLCLLLGNHVFSFAIAVAPVTSWRFYDSIYTERFLKTPQDNVKGYDEYSPLSHAQKLKGKYLLIHGTGDDNVHFQNAIEMQRELIKEQKQFESFYYPDKAHGISGGKTRLHLYQMMSDFLQRVVK
jgi:dipeptidyl-peptidase-4